MEQYDYLGLEAYRWQAGPSVFTALPFQGARLMSWEVMLAGGVRKVIHWPEVDSAENLARVRGGNPILFPFCARSFDKGRIHLWRYKGDVLPMPIHGFARTSEFKIERMENDGFTVEMIPGTDAREGYPFDYTFKVGYTFRELSLQVALILTNNGNEPLPWSAGHHFYFELPWNEGAGRGDYEIDIPAKKAYYQSAEGNLQAAENFERKSTFDNPALVDRIHMNLKSNRVVFGPKSGEENIALKVGEDPVPGRHAAVVTWSDDVDSPFYCVEPWMGPPNSHELKKGVHYVNPGETQAFVCEVGLE